MLKKWKICDLADFRRDYVFFKNHSDFNFYPIVKSLLLKWLAEHLSLKEKFEKIFKIYSSSQNRPKIYENGKKRKVYDF